jgi:TRAP-type C4-dicarboxylate transport system permease small subunit
MNRTPFEQAMSRITYAFGVAGALILIAMLLIIAIGVLLRYVFNSPITWADQVATYGLVYVTFIGAPRVLALRRHVAVDILESSISPPRQRRLRVFVDVVGTIYCIVFLYLAARELVRVAAGGAEFQDAITVPQWAVYVAIPVGAALLALQFIANLLQDWRLLRAGSAS